MIRAIDWRAPHVFLEGVRQGGLFSRRLFYRTPCRRSVIAAFVGDVDVCSCRDVWRLRSSARSVRASCARFDEHGATVRASLHRIAHRLNSYRFVNLPGKTIMLSKRRKPYLVPLYSTPQYLQTHAATPIFGVRPPLSLCAARAKPPLVRSAYGRSAAQGHAALSSASATQSSARVVESPTCATQFNAAA
ncbi:MAG TPA: hypothetical protein VF132_11755 [Rudaea sp.]